MMETLKAFTDRIEKYLRNLSRIEDLMYKEIERADDYLSNTKPNAGRVMYEMQKDGNTLKEIGEYYGGMSAESVRHKIFRYKRYLENLDKEREEWSEFQKKNNLV